MTLKLLSARAVQEAVRHIAADFTRATGHALEFSFAPMGAVRQKIAAGERHDVIIVSAQAVEELESTGVIVRGSATPIGHTSIGMTVGKGAKHPDISTPEAFRATLLAARKIALSDLAVGGTAGTYLAKLFERMGLADDIRRKTISCSGGNDVAQRVLSGEAEIGMTFISEILAVPGAEVVGPLPPPLGSDTTYTATIAAGSAQAEAGRAFIAAITDRATRGVWKTAGFELAG